MNDPGVIVDSGSFVVTKATTSTPTTRSARRRRAAQDGLRRDVPLLQLTDPGGRRRRADLRRSLDMTTSICRSPALSGPAVIGSATAYLVDIAVETVRTDAVQSFLKQETIFVELDDRRRADRASATPTRSAPAARPCSRCCATTCCRGSSGTTPTASRRVWRELFAPTRATTVGAITSLALAAVDTALWDLRCQRRGRTAVAARRRRRRPVPLYDTEGGWLHLSTDELVAGALAAQASGLAGRQAQGRQAAARTRTPSGCAPSGRRSGPRFDIMVDANQSMTHAEATRRAALFEPLDLAWFEEPLPADDLTGHAGWRGRPRSRSRSASRCTRSTQFREYLARGAAGDRPGRRGPDRRHHPVAEGRAPGRDATTSRSARTS